MNDIMMLHMMSSMMCCYYPYFHMFPEQAFRPWGKMGYPDISVRGTRYVPAYAWGYVPKPGVWQRLSRKLSSKKTVSCTAKELIDFIASVRLPDYSVEFFQGGEWHIIEVMEKHRCYALDGDIQGSYLALESLYKKTITSSLVVTRFSVPLVPYLKDYAGKWLSYGKNFLFCI